MLVFLGLLVVRAFARPAGAEAVVLVLADQHSAYERTAQLVGFVDSLRKESPKLPMAILLNGDTQEYGNVIAQRTRGSIDFAMYAALARRAPTIVNFGNHEPEFFPVDETVRRIEATGARVISNVVSRDTRQPFAPPSTRVQFGQTEAVIVGLATDNLATYRAAVRASLDLAPPAAWAREHLPELFRDAALPILLSHAGIAADREILPFVPDGTLFAGGHDHQRFVEPMGRTIYFHSGSWNSHVSLAWLTRAADGLPQWQVEQVPLTDATPVDHQLADFIERSIAEAQTPADSAVVGRTRAALAPAEAGHYIAAALRAAAGAEAAFVGNTTIGAGLPAGDVTRRQFDACVRFDGPVFIAEVSGERLGTLLAAANLGPETPFAQRRGEFNFASGPETIEPERLYRVATTDWGAKNSARYFGLPALEWIEAPGLRLKAGVLSVMKR